MSGEKSKGIELLGMRRRKGARMGSVNSYINLTSGLL